LELNTSTFILEIANFLILVWILKRFFYQPVLDIIARRQASIEATLAEANAVRSEAREQQHRYQDRLADWEREKQTAQGELDSEIRRQREQQLADLESDLAMVREKELVLVQRKLEGERQQLVDSALQQSARFATQLLSAAAGPEVERGLIRLLLDELNKLPAEQREKLRTVNNATADKTVITSAYALDQPTRRALEKLCREILPTNDEFHYQQDPAILAGVRIDLGSWVLGANLQDELNGFTGLQRDT